MFDDPVPDTLNRFAKRERVWARVYNVERVLNAPSL